MQVCVACVLTIFEKEEGKKNHLGPSLLHLLFLQAFFQMIPLHLVNPPFLVNISQETQEGRRELQQPHSGIAQAEVMEPKTGKCSLMHGGISPLKIKVHQGFRREDRPMASLLIWPQQTKCQT